MHQGQCFAACWWILQDAEEPAHHDRHPHWKIQPQKLIENAAEIAAAIVNVTPPRTGVRQDGMGAIINQLKRRPVETRLINYLLKMRVKVLFFGMLKDIVGSAEEHLSL